MLSFSYKTWLSVSIFFTITTAHAISPSPHVLLSRQQVRMDVKIIDANTVSYNGWEISNCGHPQNMTPQLNDILSFLFQLKPELEAIIADARQGTRSSHGYAAFFKTNANIRRVIGKYQSMVTAPPVVVTPERANVIGTRTPQPRFQCLSEGDLIIEQCNRKPRLIPTLPPQQPFIVHPGTERISVCPAFFRVNHYNLPQQSCPTLGANGKFRPRDGSLMTSAFTFLVHELVLLYNREIQATNTTRVAVDAIFDMQYAVNLNARQSLLNPENYAFYAGGEFGKPKIDDAFFGEGLYEMADMCDG